MSITILVGSVAALFTTFGFVPQIIKLLKTHKTDGISAAMIIQIASGLCLWVIYGIMKKDYVIILANSVGLLLAVITLSLYILLKKNND